MPKYDSGKRKRKNGQPVDHIPRPPNAWILYRATKLAYLKQAMGLGDALQQSMASKLIGQMWKDEPPEVREYYERLAEQKKAEHNAMYPDYKYKPKTKAQKQQERESRMPGPSRVPAADPQSDPGPSSRPMVATTPTIPATPQAIPPPALFPDPITSLYYPHFHYGNAGPTPPLSAAPTDADSDEQPETPNNASPSTSSTEKLDAAETVPTIHNPRPMHPTLPENLLNVPESLVAPTAFPDLHSQWPSPEQAPSAGPVAQWDLQETPAHQGLPLHDPALCFDLPSTGTASNVADPWNLLESDPLNNFNTILPTGDPSVFQLTNFEPNISGELEFSGSDGNFDLARLLAQDFSGSSSFGQGFDLGLSPSAPQNEFANLPSLFSDNTTPPSQVLPSIDFTSYQADEYLSLDAVSTRVSSASEPPAVAPSSSALTYVPPSGAAFSGTRRVGGSWKVPVNVNDGDDLTTDHPANVWGVPTR